MKNLLILSLFVLVSIFYFSDVSAQSLGMSITATADRWSDTITVTGQTVSDIADVTYRVTSPSGDNVVAIGQVSPDDNGEFMIKLTVSPVWEENGFYEIEAMQTVHANSLYTLKVKVEVNDGLTEKTFVTESNLDTGIIVPNVTRETGIEIYAEAEIGSDTITIIGMTDRVSKDITLTVIAPNGNVVSIVQIAPMLDGKFNYVVEIMGPLWKQDGFYTVTAQQYDDPKYTASTEVDIKDGIVNEFYKSAYAQKSLISVKTDDYHYEEGDTIVISGSVNTVVGNAPIIIQIIHEATYVHLAQIEVAQDGTFSESVIAGYNPLWKEAGEYTVRASYQDQIVETEFDYTPKSNSIETTTNFEVDAGSYGTFDVKYTIKGGTVKNMLVDSDIFAIIVQIDSTDEGTITLDLPREFIGAEKQDGKDDTFIILIDGIEVAYQESLVHPNSRVITVNFEEGDSDIEIVGTHIFERQMEQANSLCGSGTHYDEPTNSCKLDVITSPVVEDDITLQQENTQLKIENKQLKNQINNLQLKVDNLQNIINEQIKVIMDILLEFKK